MTTGVVTSRIIDGGLSTELAAAGHDLSDHLWSARLLRDQPQAIVQAHLAFLGAGATVSTTASYQATFEGFARSGIDHSETEKLLIRSVELAREAGDRAGGANLVAASVGPYGAMLADGSEYRGDYGLSVADLVAFHRPRMEVLASAGPDLFALETVPDLREAEALLIALDGLGVPAWLSYTVAGATTRAGQPLDDAFGLVRGVDAIVAVGVNCCAPGDVGLALEIARGASGKPLIAYPNSGEEWDATARDWTGEPGAWIADAPQWGADWLGGCCRVTPADIAVLAVT
jgi:homocysteine S-methyltransferase